MSLLHLPQGNLEVAEDSYVTGRERNEKKKSIINSKSHTSDEQKESAKEISTIHLDNRTARENLNHLKG